MSFAESLQQGNLGELIVRDFLEKQAWVRSIVDLRYDKQSQDDDVDFLVEDKNRQFHKVEVKTDFMAHKTGNLVYELSTSGHIGCFDKTKADFIAYYIVESELLHMIHAKDFKNYVYKIHRNPISMGDSAEGILVTAKELQDNGIIFKSYSGVK